ncbi:hypothetical protein Lepto7375DRAFT_8010 [Leptolyngbya sp. PCC 7375]|nr:hypothetical protein Lepto7375DRAFT_8010 [Leptolyngbya sp. PCC 7375]
MTHFSLPMRSLLEVAMEPSEIALSQPIGIILSSSGEDSVLPGERLEIGVTINNKGNQSAIIDVYLDELPTAIHDWCSTTQTRLALDPGQGEEVTFGFDVPASALSGAYRYRLIVDAPNHYPDSPPQRYEQVLQVLPPTHTTVRVNDPTFAVEPVTTTNKPVKTLPGNPLQFQIYVYNRADRVDRFRLQCTDLAEDWVTINYPQGFQSPGLAITEPYLDLNPGMEGVILLTMTPPSNALAATMLATLQLKSENNPQLKLLDVLYITIDPVYQLDTRFRTLVSRVQRQPGLYSIQASNQGNTPRTLEFKILGLEDADLCDYQIQPQSLTLAPQQTLLSQISVQPKNPWQRPLFGGGRVINFEVTTTDPEKKPLLDMPMQGLLMWEARPWWQILPVILLLLGSFIGLIWLAWYFFIRPPAPTNILRFSTEDTAYSAAQGDTVHLGFDIANPRRIQHLEIVGLSAEGKLLSGPLKFDFTQGLPATLEPLCVQRPNQLTCRNIRTDATRAGEYTFTLSLIPKPGRNATPATATALPVTITPAPLPAILELVPALAFYAEAPPQPKTKSKETQVNAAKKTQTTDEKRSQMTDLPIAFVPSLPEKDPHVARVNWKVDHPEQLETLHLVGRDAEGAIATPVFSFDFQTGIPKELTDFCLLDTQLICRNVPTSLRQAGIYTFDLIAIPKGELPENPISLTSEPTHIQPRSPRLLTFTLNGEPAQPNYLVPVDEGQPLVNLELAWTVEDNPGTQVMLMPAPGNVPVEGVLPLPLSPEPGKTLVSLQVINVAGEQLTRSITITTYDPTPESPTIVVNTGDAAAGDGDGANAAGNADAGGNNGGAIRVPVPSRPGTVSPQELPPQFE